MAQYDEQGREIPDPTPVSVPAGWSRPMTIGELIQMHIRGQISRSAAEEGMETFEEADDFEVDEDPDPLSAYEIPESPQEWPGGVKPVDPSPPQDPGKKSPDEAVKAVSGDLRNSGHLFPDSGTEKAPAGKGEAKPS